MSDEVGVHRMTGSEIAVIGMACRFPGANNPEEFWQNLRDGIESVSFFSDEELLAAGVSPAELNDPAYVKSSPILDDVEFFDADFFGYTPREAEMMDPQQRLFLECAWGALERAGYNPETYEGAVGVYAGTKTNTYLYHLASNPDLVRSVDLLELILGGDTAILAARLSYKFNLRGPSYAIQTACSTSLVAVHLACQSLLIDECQIALAGATAISIPHKVGYFYQEGSILSPDGHCRAFDANAQGFPFGSGVGVVVLKRLTDAIEDGDYIHAVIKGTATNNDGSVKASFTAPGVDGQTDVILDALAYSGLDAEDISYVETHGTGTQLGDQIEILALTNAFRASTDEKGFCPIGSAKTNVGHLDAAAGMSGFIKTVLALEHKQIPPSLHIETPNPKIDFANSPFYVNATLSEWKTRDGTPRRAGVSSFGIGGTNAHVVLEETPPLAPSSESRPWQLLVLSAKTDAALDSVTSNLADYLERHPASNLADVTHTLQVGRKAFEHRRTLVCEGRDDALQALKSGDEARLFSSMQPTQKRPVAFMFSGVGDHYVNMGRELYQLEPVFQKTVERCCDLLRPILGIDLRDVLYSAETDGSVSAQGIDLRQMLGRGQTARSSADERLSQAEIAQPAVFVIGYALAQLLQSWGIIPDALIGYSLGEYTAACVAGVLSLEDALTLVARRAQMIQRLPEGSMLAVFLSEAEVQPFLNDQICLAVVNGSNNCVLAGPPETLLQLESQLTDKGISHRRLETSHALHSTMMEPIETEFTALIQTVRLSPPQIPYLSNVTGGWITDDEATDPTYWARHLCRTVRFGDGLTELLSDPRRILLEVGPGQSLVSFARVHPDCSREQLMQILPTLSYAYDQQSDVAFLLGTLGKMWLTGFQVDWSRFHGEERRRRIPLPTYPFERQRYWIDPVAPAATLQRRQIAQSKTSNVADWLYLPTWCQEQLPALVEPPGDARWLLFVDGCGIGARLAERLEQRGHTVVSVWMGERFSQMAERGYTLNPGQRGDYEALLEELQSSDLVPNTIVHLWTVTPNGHQTGRVFEGALESGFYSLLFLAQALGSRPGMTSIRVAVVTSNAQAITGQEELHPAKATMLGSCLVIPQEHPNILCQSIDILTSDSGPQGDSLVNQLLAELTVESTDVAVAYRDGSRWVQRFEAVPPSEQSVETPYLREEGVYLIAGGLGSVGSILAEHLARTVHARLVLTGRSALPEREEWDQWLETHDGSDAISTKIRRVQALEALGSEVLVLSADVADLDQMRMVVTQAEARFGAIHGVIHSAGFARGEAFKGITETGQAEVDWHFRSKVQGLLVLEQVLQGHTPDFCLLQSSLSTVLGGLGNVAYAAANAFMDAFAHWQHRRTGTPWISVDWDSWHREDDEADRGLGVTLVELAITPSEGGEAFQRVLALDAPRIVVSTSDLQARIDQWVKLESLRGVATSHQPGDLPPRAELERRVTAIWQRVLGTQHVGLQDNFFDLGGNSLSGMQLVSDLRRELNIQISPVTLFEAPTVGALVRHLLPEDVSASPTGLVKQPPQSRPDADRSAIAVVGMTGRFPGANDLETLWQNLCNGVETISFFSDEELVAAGVDPTLLKDPNYVKARPILDNVESFDASFFGYAPREAELMDPQHRVFLECAWEALEHAGYDSERYLGAISVYAGATISTYLLTLCSQTELATSMDPFQTIVNNEKDSLATTVSYKLNLKGPSVAVQTFCSTSLVAVHMACQSLLHGECDMALAGGITIQVPQIVGYHYREGSIMSPDGHIRTFDARARGTLFGDGVGVVVLKRLTDALADGDHIHAVIKGTAINNDGSLKVGYTAPSVEGQAAAIAAAQTAAGIAPDTISYIEAHGTGTAMGDPIEIAALTKAFRAGGADGIGFCAIGSLKANVGHLDRAAGVAALIKTVLALEHKQIPPVLHFESPNPKIDFASSPFYVNTELREWPADGAPRRAGVSALGFGGTNAHAIVEEAPEVEPSSEARPWQLLVLSAKTGTALETATANLAAYLKRYPKVNLADAAYTLQVGRQGFRRRRVVVCQGHEDAIIALETLPPQRVLTEEREPRERPVAFMFTGQGAQYVQMGRELYEHEPVFREQVDRCCELLQPHLGLDLQTVLYPPEEQEEEASQRLRQTALTQPALFVIEYALAQLWQAWGVRPQAMIGHSIGEYVAACLAGVFSLEDGLALVAARGRLMQELPPGSMLAIPLPEAEVRSLLDSALSLAVINGPDRCVVSGPTNDVEALADRLITQEVSHRRLHTLHAFHSAMMDPILEPFTDQVRQVQLNPPQIPYLSNVTGAWIEAEEATDPGYWAHHLRQTVRFADGVGELLQEPERVLLEVGPGRTLSTLARRHPTWTPGQAVVTSLRHPKSQESDLAFCLTSLGRLWLAGVAVDWEGFHAHQRRLRVPLPTYPFERQRCWIEPDMAALSARRSPTGSLDKNPDIASWFYLPSWKRSLPPKPVESGELAESSRHWLMFADECGVGTGLAQQLRQAGHRVTLVSPGDQFCQVDEETYTLDPSQREDYNALLAELCSADRLPNGILHLWNVTANQAAQLTVTAFEAAQHLGFYSLLYLAQELGALNVAQPIRIEVISNRMHSVTAGEVSQPEKAPLLGLCKVLPQEYPHITCRNIDCVVPAVKKERLVSQIMAEINGVLFDGIVAYRGNQRWIQTFESIELREDADVIRPLREKGVYLVTGGLESIGLIIAEYLAQTCRAKLVILEKADFPHRSQWGQWLATHSDQDAVCYKIQQVAKLETSGAEVLVLSVDLTDVEQAQKALAEAIERFGELHGIVHAAGVMDERAFRATQETNPTTCGWHFESKVYGLFALEHVLRDYTLDFCLLVSSLSCFLGGRGYTAYAASNLFVDAFAQRHNQAHPVPWISVDWDAWLFEGAKLTAVTGDLARFAMTPAEVSEAFRRIVCTSTVDQVVVSTGDLLTRIEKWIKKFESGPARAGSVELHPRPNLQNPYVAPRNELERKIAKVWQKALGFEQIGVQDNFFELGGESFIAIQMISQLKQELSKEVSVVSLYEGSTIEALAKIIEQDAASDVVQIEEHAARVSRRKQYRQRKRSKKERQKELIYG